MKSFFVLCVLAFSASAAAAEGTVPHPHVQVVTTEGTFKLELDAKRAPLTVAHFLKLVDSGYYNGTIFHRVIADFMIQGGGHTADYALKESGESIPNESGNGLRNMRGSIAMARTGDPHSANAQFFINVVDNKALDPQPDRWGYAVFGDVIDGMDIVDKIASVHTGPAGPFKSDVPIVPIVITKVSRVDN